MIKRICHADKGGAACGGPIQIDEIYDDSVVCPGCDKLYTLEEALGPELYAELTAAQKKLKEEHSALLRDYEEANKSRPLKKLLRQVSSQPTMKGFRRDSWIEFMDSVTDVAVSKNDTDMYDAIKKHARRFDDAYPSKSPSSKESSTNRNVVSDLAREGLYQKLVYMYPKIINDSDWVLVFEKIISKDNPNLTSFKETIVERIKTTKNPNFFINIVNTLIKYAAKFNTSAVYTEIKSFLQGILNDPDTVDVLNEKFFAQRKGKKLNEHLKTLFFKILKDRDSLTNTPVWEKAQAAESHRIRSVITVVISAALAVGAIAVGILIYINSIDMKTLEMEGHGIVNIVYGEEPDLSAYRIVYTTHGGENCAISVTEDMLSGYNPEQLGTQTATVTYKGRTFEVTIHISALQLKKTTVWVDENTLIWDRIEHAKEYYIYFSDNVISAGDACYAKTEDCFFDLSTVNIGTSFYAAVVAIGESEKYEKSERSDSILIKKLEAPSDISYNLQAGTLTWSPVEEVDHYTVVLNGEAFTNIKTNECPLTLSLGYNQIVISAFSADPSVVMSTSEMKTIYQLAPVQDVVYFEDKLTWNAEGAANCYNIYCDGELVKQGYSGKVMDVSSWEPGLHTVKIVAAADSLTKLDSAPYECKIHIGARLQLQSGVLDWSALNGICYDVYVDGGKVASELIGSSMKLSSLNLSPGEHRVYVVVKDDTGMSETITVKRLGKPSLSLQNQALHVSGLTADSLFRVNGQLFDGEPSEIIDSLQDPAVYTITAVNSAVADNEISSDPAELVVKRLAAPKIAVVSGELYAEGAASVAWYVDGVLTPQPSAMTAGEHTVHAVSVADKDNELHSKASPQITVIKLPTPILTYTKSPVRELSCTFNTSDSYDGRLVYYKNGEEWIKDLDSLRGVNEITAVYTSTGGNVLHSEMSNMVSIVATNIQLSIKTSGANQITALLSEAEVGLYYMIEVTWYDGVNELGSTTYEKTAFSGSTAQKAIATNRLGQEATRMEITVRIYSSDGVESDAIKAEWVRKTTETTA